MKKILLYSTGELIKNNQTGGTKRFLELAKYLCKNQGAIVCSRDDKNKILEYGLKPYEQMRTPTGKILRFLPAEVGLYSANRFLIKKINSEGFDKVISFDVPPTVGLCLQKIENVVLMIRKDLIGYEYAINPTRSLGRWLKIKYLSMCEAFCMTHVDTIITQCKYDRDEMLKRHPLIRNRVEHKFKIQINNANPSWTVTKSKVSPIEREETSFLIGFVGNFNDGRKGHDILLEAANRLIKEGEDVCFWIIGGGKELESYKQQNTNAKIVFWGRQENPIQYIKKCDLVIVPSKADSCPNTVLEAIYNNVVVIGSRAGGIPELLEDNDALFDISAIDLYESIKKLLHNPDLFARLQNKQIKRRNDLCFDWAERIEKLL